MAVDPTIPRRAVALGLLPALAVAAGWRLERDRPFRRPVAAPRRASAALAVPPRVLAFHYPWYGIPGGASGRWRHWNHPRLAMPAGRILGFHDPHREVAPGRRDLGSTHYPLAGPYDSGDAHTVRRQLALAHHAGLDGLVVSWWGRESAEARTLEGLWSPAREAGLVLAPYYETGELWRRGAAGVIRDLEVLLDGHGLEPAWLRVGDRPVVFVYAAHRLRPPVWDTVLAHLAGRRPRPFLVVDAPGPEWLLARPGWLERFDGLHVYSPAPIMAAGRDLRGAYARLAQAARGAGVLFAPAVSPGFDDRRIRVPGTVVARDDGATYARTWDAALAASPAWILVSTWNEWHEGSEIEPSREQGMRYLEATRHRADRFRAEHASGAVVR